MSNNRGERNRKLRIRKRAAGFDEANQPIDVWQDVMTRWGQAKTSTGMAAIRSAEQGIPAAPVRYSWRINYTPVGIDVGMVAVDPLGVIYAIQEIRHDAATREYTDLVCDQGASNV